MPVAVGDPLTVVLRSVLPRGATLMDRVAHPRDALPDGVRLLSADTLQVHDGVVVGRVRVAFFRPDSQVVPAFAIAYHTSRGTDTLVSASFPILVRSVLPTGNATLRDIHDVDSPWLTPRSVGVVAGLAFLMCLAWVWLRTRHRPREARAAVTPAPEAPSAYDVALSQLRGIDASLPVERRYAMVADVVRGYLAAAHGVPALERTTPEILTALKANRSLSGFLREADRVKFAGLRPGPQAATDYAAHARSVIDALR